MEMLERLKKELTMRKSHLYSLLVAIAAVAALALAIAATPTQAASFVHGIAIEVDGELYYFEGPPDGPNGERDVPGHTWALTDEANHLRGKHYNTGPFGAPQWWSSDAPDGALLYVVDAIIDTWTPEKAQAYASRGYVHYHELVRVSDGAFHPTKVVWLKHVARTSFTLDGGPRPDLAHAVTPGVDYEFIPNWSMPYIPY